jgi:xanthine/uracil permease
MFWFPVPAESSPEVLSFLSYEMEYLKGAWTTPKILMSLLVPIFFVMLIIAAWKRSWKWLLGVVIGAAVLKVLWSVIFSGEAGLSILKPAIMGVIICVGGLYFYLRKRRAKGSVNKAEGEKMKKEVENFKEDHFI